MMCVIHMAMDEVKNTDAGGKAPRKLPVDTTDAKRRRAIKPSEIVIITLFVVIVVVLVTTLINKLTDIRDVSDARAVSNEAIADVQARNGQAVRTLGSPDFQKNYSATALTQYFRNITIATLKPPKLIDTVDVGSSSGHVVYFIYEYTALKVPYYIRTEIHDNSGKWQLISIAGNENESQLTSS